MVRRPHSTRFGGAAAALAGYIFLACVITWPLPAHLKTHLLGDPAGDTGVYVWNLWIFRHELLQHAHLPFSTTHIFGITGGADFAVHNYAPIAGMVGAPLVGTIGIVGAFNLVLLGGIVTSAFGTFMLACRLGLRRSTAWWTGAVFMASPVLVAKQTAHFSLALAAPLPLFLWALHRTLETERLRDAMVTGALVAVAFYSDAYYGIYCVMMGGLLVAWRFTSLEWRKTSVHSAITALLDAALVLGGLLLAWSIVTGTTVIEVGSIRIGLKTLYTPMLLMVILLAMRVLAVLRPRIVVCDPERRFRALLPLGAAAVSVCLVLIMPVLVGLTVRYASSRLPQTEIYWRSSRRGLDLLAYLVPNPNHAWFGASTSHWFMPDRPDAFPEFIGSFSIVALLAIAVAAGRGRLPRFWVAFTAFFGALSLGPFVHVAGINTYVIGPWAILRYVPGIGMAQSPTRFAVVTALGLSILFGFAIEALGLALSRAPTRAWAAALGTAVAVELIAAPRTLHSAAVPDVYQAVATAGDESGRLLELPTGIRDGTSSVGDFSAISQYFQTLHQRPVVGGYLSRVSRWRKQQYERLPMMRAIFALSEGRPIEPTLSDAARSSRTEFLRRSCVRFVIVHKRRALPGLRSFAADALELALVHEDADYELFVPIEPPPCAARPRHERRAFRDWFWREDP